MDSLKEQFALFNAIEKKIGITTLSWRLEHRPRILAVERFQYNPKHWINQFDLNIYTKFNGTISKDSFNTLKTIEVKDSENDSQNKIYYIKSKIVKITHIYRISPNKTSNSIILYIPENIKQFKKRYQAIQDSLDNYRIHYDESENIYLESISENIIYVWNTIIKYT